MQVIAIQTSSSTRHGPQSRRLGVALEGLSSLAFLCVESRIEAAEGLTVSPLAAAWIGISGGADFRLGDDETIFPPDPKAPVARVTAASLFVDTIPDSASSS